MLELVSYNIFNGRNLGKIAGWIKSVNRAPDIICFQEFPEHKLAEIKEKLQNIPYSYEFAPAFFKKKIMYGELTAYKNDTLKLLKSEVIELGAGRLDRVIYRRGAPKTVLITKFKHGDKTFYIANVHLIIFALHRSRKRQLAKTISQLEKKTPAIIVGDYNYSILMGRKRGLIKFMKENDFHMAGQKVITHKFFKIPQQIDYAFYKDLEIEGLTVGKIKYSDHFPIRVKFSV